MEDVLRRIVDLGEHSIYQRGLQAGGRVLDCGANRGAFGLQAARRYPVEVAYVEANPVLAAQLAETVERVVSCAVGANDGVITFHIGENDEASSIFSPMAEGGHLQIKESVEVPLRSLGSVLAGLGFERLACVKLDIEGAEVDLLTSLAPRATEISPQWTVEFHDAPEFQISKPADVTAVLKTMRQAGFSVLVRNWPSRTNVLFVDRRALKIGLAEWLQIKLRYEWVAWLWRQVMPLKAALRRGGGPQAAPQAS